MSFVVILCVYVLAISMPGAVYGQFTTGKLAILRVGDGSAALGSSAQILSITEYDTLGAPSGFNVTLPYSGGGTLITNSGSATSEGQMIPSAERDRLVLVGYNAASGTANIKSTASAATSRVVFTVNSAGTYSAVASTSTGFSANNVRSGTASGANYFAAGANAPGIGLLGSPTTVQLPTATINARVVQIFNGQLYFSSASGAFVGINALGTNIPLTSGQSTALINTSPTSSSYGFSISPDGNTLYVADDASGITKYTKSGSTFGIAYTLNATNATSLTVDYSGPRPVIYAVTTSSTIIKITDAGTTSPSTTLPISAPTNTAFRSISFSPYCGATATLLGTSPVCAGNSASFVLKGNPTGLVSYNINGGSTLSTTIGANGYDTITTPALVANTTINLLTINTQACLSSTLTATATVNVIPAISITTINVSPAVCAGTSVNMNVSITGSSNPYSYVWNGPSGYTTSTAATAATTNSITVTTSSVTPVNPSYSVTVTDVNGCIAKGSVTATVNPLPIAYLVNGSNSYCAGTSGVDVQLSNSQAGVNYQLYNGSTLISTLTGSGGALDFGNQPFGTYTVLGTYSVSGCPNNMSGAASITLNPLPAVITGTVTVCQGYTTALTDADAPGTWTSSNSSIAAVGSTGIVTGGTAGTANITYAFASGCGVHTTVTVNPLTGITGNAPACMGSILVLTDATTGGAWSSGNTGVANIDGLGNVSPTGQGTATITYALVTGCAATAVVTVNPLPGIITGTMTVCVGSTTTLSDADGGGSWSSSAPATGTVGSSSGIVAGIASGVTNIIYTLPTSCAVNTQVTVNALPNVITGTDSVCMGSNTTLTDASSPGVWGSLNTGVANVTGTGFVSTVSAGTATITYSLLTGCKQSVVVTVNALPANILGTTNVCQFSTVTLSDTDPGGTWSSNATGVGTIGSTTGVVYGVASGVTNIIYTLPTSCQSSVAVTVNQLPVTITGTLNVCSGLTTALTDVTGGGTWTSDNIPVASVGSTGLVTGGTSGTADISYTISATGCKRTTTVTVNANPQIINGQGTVCAGSSITLTDVTTPGTWSVSNPAAGTINSTTGSLTGINAGTTTVTYTVSSGCIMPRVITVNALPSAISGATNVCKGSSTTLTDTDGGGTWSSSATGTAPIDGSGNVSGTLAGTATITYTLPTTCYITTPFTVNALPSAISGTLSVCKNANTSLSDADGGGSWTSNLPGTASINGSTGTVTGNNAGTAIITYALPTTCQITAIVTVNALPATITGTMTVCAGSVTNLTDIAGGGSWTSSPAGIGTVDGTGHVAGIAAGTVVVTYTLPTTCATNAIVTVNPLPVAIAGNLGVCLNASTTLSDAGGGYWTSSAPGTASVGSGSGIVNGLATGTAIITYTLPTGCANTNSAIVTVNPLPANITGSIPVCPGFNISLSDVSGGGVWSSLNTGIATVGTGSGTVTGVATGNTVISYTLSLTGCAATTVITINATPLPITGNRSMCAGLTSALSDATAGGTWSSSTPDTASINSLGVVSGHSSGTATITYTPTTGCFITTTVSVDPLPVAISGSVPVCPGTTATLSDLTCCGTWSSNDPTIATAGSTSGIITGVSAGSVSITYTLGGTGCTTTTIVTVNPLPTAINGNANVCPGTTTILTDATAPGTWGSAAPATASIDVVTGMITGHITGTTTITYTLATGCAITRTVTVNPFPPAITGTSVLCVFQSTNLSDGFAGGTWSSNDNTVAPVSTSSGVVSGFAAGTATITYTSAAGCATTTTVTVNALPGNINGSQDVCPGLTTSLTDITTGGAWGSDNTAVATVDAVSGVVTGIAPGTAAITYTAAITGCTATVTVTVGVFPPAISGAAQVCVASAITLSDSQAGGIWSSGSTNVLIDASTGVVTGSSAGTAMITYTNVTGCIITTVITVNPLPSVITGGGAVCAGLALSLSDALSGGVWTSTGSTGVISIGSATGIVSGIATGVANITYTLPTGCNVTTTVTVNPLPSSIYGPHSICAGLTSPLSDITTGGSWSSDLGSLTTATIDVTSGMVTALSAGTTGVTYALPTGCIATTIITINPLPAGISGTDSMCVGSGVTLTDATAGGVWISGSGSLAAIGSSTGMVTGIAAGSVMITYKLPTGCISTTTLTIDPLPAAIAGNRSVCLGATSILSDLLTGGTWSIGGSSTVATVGVSSGAVLGFALGTATVTYELSTGCSLTAMVTVNPYPKAINGYSVVCQGSSIILSDSTAGGNWSSGNPLVAAAAVTGEISGAGAGTVYISYTLPTGCAVVKSVTVNPLFPISGNAEICAGSINSFSDGVTGGTWSGGSTLVATIGSSGLVTGIIPGVTIITYSLPTGCVAKLAVTVNPVPFTYDITGGGSYCAGGTGVDIGLNGSDTGISYRVYYGTTPMSSLTGTDSALDFGLFTGAGHYTIIAANNITGCSMLMHGIDTINAVAAAVPIVSMSTSPGATVCVGDVVFFTASPVNGGASPLYTWYVNGVNTGVSGATYSYVPVDHDSVSVKLISDLACASPDSAISYVKMATVTHFTPSVSLIVTPGDSLCPGIPVTITPIPVDSGASPTYTWIKNGITAATGPSYNYTPANGDNIFCMMHSSFSCADPANVHSDNNIEMIVPEIYVPVVSIAAYPGTRVAFGESVTLVASVAFSGLSFTYQWAINNLPVAGATTDTFVSSFTNHDSVSCVVLGNSLCGSTSRAAEVIIIDTIGTAVQAAGQLSDIVMIPNPNKGVFIIRGSLPRGQYSDMDIEVTDMLGQVVYSDKNISVKEKIDQHIALANTLPNGMYLLSLHTAFGNKVIHFEIEQ